MVKSLGRAMNSGMNTFSSGAIAANALWWDQSQVAKTNPICVKDLRRPTQSGATSAPTESNCNQELSQGLYKWSRFIEYRNPGAPAATATQYIKFTEKYSLGTEQRVTFNTNSALADVVTASTQIAKINFTIGTGDSAKTISIVVPGYFNLGTKDATGQYKADSSVDAVITASGSESEFTLSFVLAIPANYQADGKFAVYDPHVLVCEGADGCEETPSDSSGAMKTPIGATMILLSVVFAFLCNF